MRPAGSRSAAAAPLTLADCSRARVAEALGADGLWLDLGAATLRVRSDSPEFAAQLQRVYGAFPFVDVASWADVHVDIERVGGLRRWWRPQVRLRSDGRVQFEPFPADSPLPLFEWGCNWLMAQRLNDLLLLHAGSLERDGLALLLPALPGSGKSTLTAALSSRGWRLLSDEFGVFDPNDGALHALVKPVGLKNRSIDVIRSFAPQAVMGPSFPKTRKGTVAHLAPPADAVARRHEPARPGAVILPKWQEGAATRLEPVEPRMLFPALAFNAFNYGVLGAAGFDAAVSLTNACPAWHLLYSDLDSALEALEALWPEVRRHHGQAIPAAGAAAGPSVTGVGST